MYICIYRYILMSLLHITLKPLCPARPSGPGRCTDAMAESASVGISGAPGFWGFGLKGFRVSGLGFRAGFWSFGFISVSSHTDTQRYMHE